MFPILLVVDMFCNNYVFEGLSLTYTQCILYFYYIFL